MKFYLIVAATAILLASCLKQSIPDAMLGKGSGTGANATATLSYKLNGNPVNITVTDAGNQDPNNYTLGCSKSAGYYSLSGLSDAGETSFLFFTDSLTTGVYTYTANYGDMFFISYNGENEFVHGPTDSLSFTITSFNNGYISGSFSGQLTPYDLDSNSNGTYGPFGSVLITNGSFKNVPVFY